MKYDYLEHDGKLYKVYETANGYFKTEEVKQPETTGETIAHCIAYGIMAAAVALLLL